ncbi:hypothetical protein Pla123a_30170 [Posidoniimonas polymericola]|uniref:DUF3102 domain-containing protein n=1 Tax=Posidoniimonas polymericola TaxID=2528002 RepID=A0A5C5YL22_9BACT|nr:DUF3102 domain-containing protein [Posidoniimonas polymericola]TWT75508.1 hypothetical protein Pla123a_30170 [Posidoniimonas polymericola]
MLTETNHSDQPIAALTLAEIPATLRAETDAANRSASQAIEHAMRAGELLAQAKGQLEHGEWLSWLDSNFSGSRRTAQQWMRLAAGRERLQMRSDCAFDSIADAVRALQEDEQDDSFSPPAIVDLQLWAKAHPECIDDDGEFRDDFHCDAFPPLDGRQAFFGTSENVQCQIWPLGDGYSLVSSVRWRRGDSANGVGSETKRPVRLNHAHLAFLLASFGVNHQLDWRPIRVPVLGLPTRYEEVAA